VLDTEGSKTEAGWENLVVTGKWQAYTNAPHEFVVSLGIIREIGGSATNHTGGDRFGSTAPTLYGGKGFGDIPVPLLQPFAVTGELGYTIADEELKQGEAPPPLATGQPTGGGFAPTFNNGNNNAWSAGISLQYSLPYLQSQVRDIGLDGFLGNLVPLVEFTWSSPASSPSTPGTSWIAAPGAIYMAQWGEVGVEALIPLNRTAGTNVGVVGLVHFFFDDLFPNSPLGRPIFQ